MRKSLLDDRKKKSTQHATGRQSVWGVLWFATLRKNAPKPPAASAFPLAFIVKRQNQRQNNMVFLLHEEKRK
jgi:hypothetical protein